MNRLIISLFAAGALTGACQARTLDAVLGDIERNNLELRALQLDNRSAGHTIDSENDLSAPSIEYSPFFHRGANGVASSELVVSQEFDFPTLYAARRKSGQRQKEALEAGYRTRRRDILLEAKLAYLDLTKLTREQEVLAGRKALADSLLALCDRRMRIGEATAIELNAARIEQMDINAALIDNESARRTIENDMTALNGGKPLDLGNPEYPPLPALPPLAELMPAIIDNDAALAEARSQVIADREQTKVSRQSWAPGISVGYRRNTDGDEASNGFLVGLSFPLYSTRNRVKAAESKSAASQLNEENLRISAENSAVTLYEELSRLRDTLEVYDIGLMKESLELIRKSVNAGNMSLAEYYSEADKIEQKLISYLSVENRYHRILAELLKYKL